MGFRDRDWYRDGGKGTRYGAGTAVGGLIVANIAVFVGQLIATYVMHWPVTEWLGLSPYEAVHGGRLWQPLTSLFLHDPLRPFHIIFNMLVLWMFGPGVEARLGVTRFLTLYFGAGLLASASFVAWGLAGDPFTPAIGASGAIMGVAVYYAFIHPYEYILFLFMFPMRTVYAMAIVVGLDLYQFAGHDGVAHTAHLGGALFGLIFYRIGGRPPRRKREVSEVAMKAQVDTLLDKIHRMGIGSLTDEEREFLERASKAYRGGDRI